MKKFKRFMAVLLSAVLLMSIAPLSVFAGGTPDELTYYYDDDTNYDVYKYATDIYLGNNTLPEMEEHDLFFCSFNPIRNGIYCFDENALEVTADTDDDKCYADELEESWWLTTETEYDDDKLFVYLTVGKTYYVLCSYYYSDINISFCGIVTDINPESPLTNLVEDVDIYKDTYNNMICLEDPLKITFTNYNSVYLWGVNFDEGFYTDNTLTVKLLGFEKVLNYSTINVNDMIASIEVKEKVNLVKYFNGDLILEKPVTAVIKFTDGTSKEIVIESYWNDPEFEGTNRRTYSAGLSYDEDNNITIYAAGFEVKTGSTIKRAGFFKNISYYFARRNEIREYFSALIKDAGSDVSMISSLLKARNREMMILGLYFIKSLFSFK